jgi:hypothetical protein
VRIVTWTSRAAQAVAPLVHIAAEALTPIITELCGLWHGLAARYRDRRAARQRVHSRPSAPALAPSTTRANPSPARAIPADRRTAARKITTNSETTTVTHRTT